MASNGRPTKYKPEYDEQAYKLCLLGHTDVEMAEFFEVTTSTIYQWKIDYPSFSEAIKNGKDIADIEVVQSLRKRALGMKLKKQVIKDGTVIELEDEIAPDPTSMIFWLKNRQPKAWRDKQVTELEGGIAVEQKSIASIFEEAPDDEEDDE